MRLHRTFAAVFVAVLLVCGTVTSEAQLLQKRAARARGTVSSVLGAQATAMGGAFVAVANDGTALYWNPAALADHRNTRIYGAIGGASQNIDTAEDLADVVDILSEEDELSLEDFTTIRDVTIDAAGNVVEGDLGAIGAIEMNNFALGYWLMAGGSGQLQYEDSLPASERVDWDADAVGQAGAGVAYGRDISGNIDLGITARAAAFSVADAVGEATADYGQTTTVTLDNAHDVDTDTSYTADIGLMYTAGSASRFGLVGRNLTSPSFDLELERPSGATETYEYEIEPSVDFGYAYTAEDGGIFAVDVHNITEANDLASEVAVGINEPLADWLDLRLGYGDDQPTFGLGLHLGSLQIDLASALTWEDRVGISGSATF